MLSQTTPQDAAKKMMDVTSDFLRCILNMSLSAKYGPNWVAAYINQFNKEVAEQNKRRALQGRPAISEMANYAKSISDFDLQACLKLLCYMDDYRNDVFRYYNINDPAVQKEIVKTAFRLIDFRNNYSHRSHTIDLYTCENAMTSMRWLISVFPTMYNENTGEAFISKANAIYTEYYRQQHPANGNTTPPAASPAPAYPGAYTPAQMGMAQSAAKPKKKSKFLIVLCSILAALLLIVTAILIVVVLQNNNRSESSQVSSREVIESSSENSASDSSSGSGSGESSSQNSSVSSSSGSSSEPQTSSGNGTQSAAETNQIPQEYQALFEASNANWREHLKVGDTHISSYITGVSSMWSNVRGYSEDTSIATVGEDYIVTAKAPGVVRILYVGEFMGEDRMYIVEYTVTN